MNRGRSLNSTGNRAAPSSRSQTPATLNIKTNGQPTEGIPSRQQSLSYGHHRNTSIVHGIQHSRTASFAHSPTTNSPLSPEMIAAAMGMAGLPGGPFDGNSLPENEIPNFTPLTGYTSSNGTLKSSAASSLAGTTAAGSEFSGGDTMRRPERVQSMKTRRDRNDHGRSQSKHHPQQELKTVGEYALHHLFNSVRLSPPP